MTENLVPRLRQMKSGHPHRTAFRLVLAGILISTLSWFIWGPREPVYQGKTLTAWLYNSDPDFVWMPNDLYGHIHNELWEALVAGSHAGRDDITIQSVSQRPNPEPDLADVATRQIGTNAIPRLLELMASRPGLIERSRDALAPKLPARFSVVLFRTQMIATAARCHYAAMKGFRALGTNAESALPALSKLLRLPGADFELGSAIAGIGPKGGVVLLNALTNADSGSRDVAAFYLGNDSLARTSALPALLRLVENGQGTYHVLGAIGRFGGKPELVVPVLSRFLQRATALLATDFETDMAIMILGLYREKARSAIPVVLKLYKSSDQTTRQVIRVVIKNMHAGNARELLGMAPTDKDDEDPWWNGPNNSGAD